MANAKTGDARSSIVPSYSAAVTLIGFASSIATLLGLLAFPDMRLSFAEALVEKVAMALALAVGFLLFYMFANRFATKRGEVVTCLIATVGLVVYSVGIALPVELWLGHVVCNCIAAFGIAALLSTWFADLCLNTPRFTHSFVAIASGIGLLVCVTEYFFSPGVRALAFAIVGGVSVILAFVKLRSHMKAEAPLHPDAKKTDARSRIQPESVIMLAIINAQFGYLIGSAHMDAGESLPFIFVTAIVTSLVIALDAASKRQRFSEASIYPVTIPLTVMALLAMYLFGGGVVHTVALCMLTVVDTFYIISGIVALNKHVILAGLSPVRTYGRARAIDYSATAGGIALGFAAGWAFEQSWIMAIQITAGIAVAYAFIASFFHKARFPDSTVKADGSVGFAPAQEKGQWKRRCREVSERYSLSDRQYEVLCLIGQGRNAEYVANALTISVSTVQTHIRNIYQKLGVHSRQELLDLIENTKLYGED